MTDTLDFEDGVQKVYAGVSHVEGEHPPSGQEEMIGKMKTSLDVNVVCVEKHSWMAGNEDGVKWQLNPTACVWND